MDKDKLNLFVKSLVAENKKEEIDVLWSFLFSGCPTGFGKFTEAAKEHFAKIFKQSLETKYEESNPFEIIDNVTKPIEVELGGLNVGNIYNDQAVLAQVLLSNKTDEILIDEFKRKVKELGENDKEILDLVLGFIESNKSSNIGDKFSIKHIELGSSDLNEICKFLHGFKNIDKKPDGLTYLLVSNGFILSPYIGSGAAYSTSEEVVIPLFLLEVYTKNFLPTTLISKIKNWQEKIEEKIERVEKEQKIEWSSWGKRLREKEEVQKQVENKLKSYISELIKNKDSISIDAISTLAFNSTAKSYVDKTNANPNSQYRERAKEFEYWLRKLAIENIKIKHSLKEKEARKKVNEALDKFFETFPNFLSYEYYDYNISALCKILKDITEVKKENEIKSELESFNEKEKRAISFLIEYIKSELAEFLDGEIVALNSVEETVSYFFSKFELRKCNQIINHIFEENFDISGSFKRLVRESTPFMETQIVKEKYLKFEIGDIAVKSGFALWCPRITGSVARGFKIELVFPICFITKSWENLPKIPNLKKKIVEVESQRKSDKFSESVKEELGINLDEFTPFGFERFISQLFGEMGYEVWPTRRTGDYGVDIIAKKEGIKIGIQAKRFERRNLVGAPDVQKTLGSRFKYNVDKCILITTSDFTPQAREQARNAPIELWNRSILEEKIKKYLLDQ